MFGGDKLNKRLSQIDFFIGVTGRSVEIADRVYDEVVAVIERGASRLPIDADLLMAGRLLDRRPATRATMRMYAMARSYALRRAVPTSTKAVSQLTRCGGGGGSRTRVRECV
jgi:hypothetical protein